MLLRLLTDIDFRCLECFEQISMKLQGERKKYHMTTNLDKSNNKVSK